MKSLLRVVYQGGDVGHFPQCLDCGLIEEAAESLTDRMEAVHFPQCLDCGLIEGFRYAITSETPRGFPQCLDCGLIEGADGALALLLRIPTVFPQCLDCGLIEASSASRNDA